MELSCFKYKWVNSLDNTLNNMKLIGKNVLITQVNEEVKTSSGLLLSSDDASNFRYSKGVVVQPGSDVNLIKKDDVIYYDKGKGYTMLIENDPYTVIQESAVVVVL